jgi:hypothetical protein
MYTALISTSANREDFFHELLDQKPSDHTPQSIFNAATGFKFFIIVTSNLIREVTNYS